MKTDHLPTRAQSGFLLIESLIALLLFSIGILGLIGMQAAAAKITAESQYRAEASMHADHLISQMRSGDRSTLVSEFSTGGNQYEAWLLRVQDPHSGLPGSVQSPPTVVVNGNPPTITITIFWKGPGETVNHQYVSVATIN